MATFTDYEKAALVVADSSFQSRVKGVVINSALTIKGEAYTPVVVNGVTGPSVRSQKRAALADKVLFNANEALAQFTNVLSVYPAAVAKFSTQITVDPDVASPAQIHAQVLAAIRSVTDAEIQTVVNAIWDDLSGVNAWD